MGVNFLLMVILAKSNAVLISGALNVIISSGSSFSVDVENEDPT